MAQRRRSTAKRRSTSYRSSGRRTYTKRAPSRRVRSSSARQPGGTIRIVLEQAQPNLVARPQIAPDMAGGKKSKF